MNYVAQKHSLGCLIAAGAMVFDLSYDRAGWFIPLPREEDLIDGSVNEITELSVSRLQSLSNLSGKVMSAPDGPPFDLKEGCRYIAWLETDRPNFLHSVAVDEAGIVFDPDSDNQDVRKHWTEYSIKVVLEFRPIE
ncbi:MAG TPA: hypothetical protein VJW20_16875 [Candidatus Angelobacter sp.]|nr:hypothetical protein [Candidatus Angelobacter sp.]